MQAINGFLRIAELWDQYRLLSK